MQGYNLLSARSELDDVTPHHGDLQYHHVELLTPGYPPPPLPLTSSRSVVVMSMDWRRCWSLV